MWPLTRCLVSSDKKGSGRREGRVKTGCQGEVATCHRWATPRSGDRLGRSTAHQAPRRPAPRPQFQLQGPRHCGRSRPHYTCTVALSLSARKAPPHMSYHPGAKSKKSKFVFRWTSVPDIFPPSVQIFHGLENSQVIKDHSLFKDLEPIRLRGNDTSADLGPWLTAGITTSGCRPGPATFPCPGYDRLLKGLPASARCLLT